MGAHGLMSERMTIGMFIAFLAYRDQFRARVVNLIGTIVKFRMLSVHENRLSDIVLTEREDDSSYIQDSLLKNRVCKLEMRNVCFSYGDGMPPILDRFNLVVQPGESIALVGPSGSGKTTALKLLAGLLPAASGDVLLGGESLKSIGLDAYRSITACVLQEDRLFAGSIAENIAGFEPEVEYDWMVSCAQMASIDAEIRQMPMGYETLVGDMGSALSGGQKQRLFLARALYRRLSVLLLDEATSHLDESNERIINRAITDLSITRVIVAHRSSTIALADRIVSFASPVEEAKAIV